jgi:hypothetical protein
MCPRTHVCTQEETRTRPHTGATELAQLFKSLGTPMSYEKVADVFMRYDKDESGQIEFGERWRAVGWFCVQAPTARTRPRPRAATDLLAARDTHTHTRARARARAPAAALQASSCACSKTSCST